MWDNRMAQSVETIKGSGAPDRAVEDEAPPSIVINPHSDLGKELRKWEQHYSYLVPPGTRPGNPYTYRPFPKMLYMADRGPNGQTTVVLPSPSPWDYPDPNALAQAQNLQENWNRQHQRVVKDESEFLIAKGQGWAEGPGEALEAYEAKQQVIAEAAAQASFYAQRMSEQARAELEAAHADSSDHVVDVQPKRGPGRPKTVTGSGPIE